MSIQFPTDVLRKCWFLTGPTATGKSEVGCLLAQGFDAEIVALDSMSLYRGMDVGTAKPTTVQRHRVPHHLIDVIEPHEEYSLADYVAQAEAACRGILGRGRTPLFVGGTGLYLRGVLRGVFEGPSADWSLRRRLHQQETEIGPGALHASLREVDPATAERLHPHDARRIVRALEVFHLTGHPLSQLQRQGPLPPELRPSHVYWLCPPRQWLYERVNRRVDSMIDAGLLDEVRGLLQRETRLSRTARQAIGYRELIEYLSGVYAFDDAVERIRTRTRQFAKRQHTWFRNLEECHAIEISGEESAPELAARIGRLLADGDPPGGRDDLT